MTTADKLCALDQIWPDLSRSADELPSPPWHEDVLQARERRAASGESKFVDWTKAKAEIRGSGQ